MMGVRGGGLTVQKKPMCTFQILGVSGSKDRGEVTTVSKSLILEGWVTKVLKNGDEK